MSRVILSPEAASLYQQTIDRGVARSFIVEWSSAAEARDQITWTFYAAAGVNEQAEGSAVGEDRYLDVSEARLAIAALNLAASGDRWIAANEGRSAHERLQETIDTMLGSRFTGQNPGEYLMWQCSERGRGWRRIRNETVQRDIRGVFHGDEVEGIDARPGLDPADAVFAAYGYNTQAGGSDATIGFNDAMWSGMAIESALRGLRTFYT